MKELISLPMSEIEAYGGTAAFEREIRALGCDGAELIWSGGDLPRELPCPDCLGYHLIFYPDWLDLWHGDTDALNAKYGSEAAWRAFYGGGREELIARYAEDAARAAAAGARYVVFHVSDVSIEEGYTYRWLHSDEAVIDAAAELINTVCPDPPYAVFVENQWWPGFTFTSPKLTARLIDAVAAPDKGILLDTGHLMNCNTDIKSEAEGARFIHEMLDAHGELAEKVRAMHLHCSVSGEYVKKTVGTVPAGFPTDCFEQFAVSYAHILQIDRHRPWTDSAVRSVVERIAPEYLTHELAAQTAEERSAAVRRQRAAMGGERG